MRVCNGFCESIIVSERFLEKSIPKHPVGLSLWGLQAICGPGAVHPAQPHPVPAAKPRRNRTRGTQRPGLCTPSAAGAAVLAHEQGPASASTSESHPISIREHRNLARGEMWKQLL